MHFIQAFALIMFVQTMFALKDVPLSIRLLRQFFIFSRHNIYDILGVV